MLSEIASQPQPQFGPSILFFSGGSALANFSKTIKSHTHNSIHLVTTFDSGGCSAQLRQHFNMPAIGDIRNRLLALANTQDPQIAATVKLLDLRLPSNLTQAELKQQLIAIVQRQMPHFQKIPLLTQNIICRYLNHFYLQMPAQFNLQAASIGNLCLAGGYLLADRQIRPIIDELTQLLEIKGQVEPIVEDMYHLVAEFADGELITGQHLITGKEVAPIQQKISQLFISASDETPYPITPSITPELQQIIQNADLICYPPGSFYSSILANLLPKGVGRNIAKAKCNKVYIPNLGQDPEQYAMSIMDTIQTLLTYLKNDCDVTTPYPNLLNHVVLDNKLSRSINLEDENLLVSHGINLIRTDLITKKSAPYYDNDKLVKLLISLAK